MPDYIEAATSLVKKLNAPPQAHSVYIRSDVDETTKQFKRTICVSVRPEWKSKIQIPDKHMGFQVEEVPWPKDM